MPTSYRRPVPASMPEREFRSRKMVMGLIALIMALVCGLMLLLLTLRDVQHRLEDARRDLDEYRTTYEPWEK